MAQKTEDKDIQKGEQAKVGVKDSDLTQLSRNDLMTELYRRGRTPEDVMTGRNLTGPEIEAVATLNELNKGGMPKQMEMFDNGGLKDEGGMIDEVSGNDVPTGSTREEVRDDIPAQLSEGEFVLPADVVRFHGLEKIMELRDEAKAGLAKMEAMGQMGNSEEATLPDEMPFSLDDLDMEDEDEPQEMAEGGYVMVEGKPMPIPMIGGQLPPITTRPMPETKNMAVGGFTSPTGTYQVPTNIATQPSYFQNYQQSTAPFQPFTGQTQTQQPIQPLQQQQTFPSFSTLMPTVGGKRETIEYRNDAGQKLFIPFVDGKPIYPIPEGYSKYTAETEVTPEKQPTVQTTTVRQDQQDGGDDNVLSGTSQVRGLDNSIVSTDFASKSTADVQKDMANMSLSDRGSAVMNALEQAKGYTGVARGIQQLGTAVVPGVLAGKMYGQKTMNPMDVLGKVGAPNTDQLNAMLNAFGPSTVGLSPEEIDMQGIDRNEALSQAVFGMSLNDTKNAYGVTPSFEQKNEPGSFSPTGAFYDIYGSATSSKGDAEFASAKDFTNNFKAMVNSKTSFTGKSAIDTINDPNASDKAKENANRHLRELEKITGKMTPSVSDARDKAAVRDPSGGIGPSTGIGSQNIGIEDISFFEVGPVFIGDNPDEQKQVISGIRIGNKVKRDWKKTSINFDFYDIKLDVLKTLDAIGIPQNSLKIHTDAPQYFHPGRSAVLKIGESIIANLGEIHPEIVDFYSFNKPIIGFEIFFENIPFPKRKKISKPMLKIDTLQQVTREFAFVVDEEIDAEKLVQISKSINKNLIKDVLIYDVYQGNKIPINKKSIAIKVIIQPLNETLTDIDLEKISSDLIIAIEKKVSGFLREQ